MPQLDIYIAFSEVFWFTILFILFYIFIVRDILPEVARSIKLRKKKVGRDSNLSKILFEEESIKISKEKEATLEKSLRDSKISLQTLCLLNTSWFFASLKKINEEYFINLNKKYLKIIGEFKGRIFLLGKVMEEKKNKL